MKRWLILLAVLAIGVITCGNPVATITQDPNNPIAPATPADIDDLYQQLASRITAQVTAEIDGKILAARQQTWQQFTDADKANAELLLTQMDAKNKAAEIAMIQNMIVVLQARFTALQD